MAKTNQGSRNNNPQGRNQYSSDWMSSARERPMASAAVAAAAVGAGVFLWSRRDQISNQISQLSDQIGQWTDNMQSGSGQNQQFETSGASSTEVGTGGGLGGPNGNSNFGTSGGSTGSSGI
ncbi:MAG: hypothetical protein ACJ8E7_11165 [Sphingomicrobium sp.]